MNVWETQEAEETARNAQWEDMNSTAYDKGVLASIQSNLEDAMSGVYQAMEELEKARKQVAFLPLEDELKDTMNYVETLQDDILTLQDLVRKEMSA